MVSLTRWFVAMAIKIRFLVSPTHCVVAPAPPVPPGRIASSPCGGHSPSFGYSSLPPVFSQSYIPSLRCRTGADTSGVPADGLESMPTAPRHGLLGSAGRMRTKTPACTRGSRGLVAFRDSNGNIASTLTGPG